MNTRRLAPATLGILVLLLACTDLLGPRGGNSVRLVVQPSFGQVPATALADNPASRMDNVHLLLRNAGGTVVRDTIVEWPLDQDTLRMEMDVVVQETGIFEITIEGRSGDRILFQAGPLRLDLSDDDSGGTVEASPVLEYVGPGAEVATVEITGGPDSFLAGSTVSLGATGANDDGSEPEDLIIVWTSLDPDAATVDEDGRVQVGHDASRAVSIEGRVAFTTVTDTIGGPILPAELTLSPEASTLTALGADLTLTTSLLGEDGGDVTGVPVTWSVSDESVLELAAEGDEGGSAVATALAPGATRVIATAGDLADSADVTVEQTVSRLEVEPDSVTLEQVGATAEATAAAFDANDHEVEDAEVAWSTGDTDVATVAEDGTITAVSPGTAWITGTSGEASDSLRARVANVAPELAITSPADGATFEEGDPITFEGTAEDLEDGDLSSSIEWSSDLDGELGTGASVSVDDLSIGSHTITAEVVDSHGTSASATVVIEVDRPNLVLADMTVDASEPLRSDDTLRITAEVVNAGQVESAAADVAVRALHADTEAVLAQVIANGPALAAGETRSLVLDLSNADPEDGWELELEGDSILFEAEVDPDDAIAETDETDNAQRSRAFEAAVELDLPPGVTSGWVGTSSDWREPSNWFPLGVPTAEDVVLVPASADEQPVLTASATVGGLLVEDGATLDVNGDTLTVTGDLDAGSTIVDGTGGGAVVMAGEGAALLGTVPHLRITGQVAAAGTVHVTSDVSVAGEGSELRLGPHRMTVGDDFTTVSGGILRMDNAEGVLDVNGLADFAGGESVLTAGTLRVAGDFVQGAGNHVGKRAFRARPGHLTVFDGSGTQTIHMLDPGSPDDGDFSFFGTLEVANTGDGLFLNWDVRATGALVVPPQEEPAIFGDAFTVTVAGLDVDGLTLDKTQLLVRAGPDAPMRFDNVTFQAYDDLPDLRQLNVFHPGADDPFTFENIVFDPDGADGETSFLIDAEDTKPDDAFVLTIDLINPTPLDGSALTIEFGGAVVNWPGPDLPEGATVGWVGVSSDWHEPGNWTSASTPTSEDVVFIDASAPEQPVLTDAVTVDGLIVEAGASLDLAGFDLTVTGDLDAGSTITNSSSTSGRVVMSGVESTLKGTLPELHIDGIISTAGAVHVRADLSVGGAGSLTVGPHQVDVDGDMSVVDDALLSMGDVDGVVDIAQNVSFQSTKTSRPAAGELRAGGSFSATAVASNPSFSARGTHRTVLDGTGPQAIDIDLGGFQDLEIAGGGAVETTTAIISGNLEVTTAVTLSAAVETAVVVHESVATVAGSGLSLYSLVVGGELEVGGMFEAFTTTFTGIGQTIPALPYEHVNVHGPASLVEATEVGGNFFVGDTGGSTAGKLDIAGQTLTIGGLFHTLPASVEPAVNSGVLIMDQPGGVLDIGGRALFEGGESVLTEGTIRIGADFSQDSEVSGVTNNFAAQSGLRVVLDGQGPQAVDFMDPGESHFGTLELGNYSSSGVSLGTHARAVGALHASPSQSEEVPTVSGEGTNELTVAGVAVDGLVLDNTPLIIEDPLDRDGPDLTGFDGVTFQNFLAEVRQLTIRHPGAAGPFVFDRLTFDQNPDPPVFLRVEDTDTGDDVELVIELTDPTPVDGSAFTEVMSATVLWP